MGLTLSGYILEPPRVGPSNSTYTYTPNAVVVDQTPFNLAFPSNEANPRVEYHGFVFDDGSLHEATFGWTKNEVISRFDFDGANQRFRPLPGSAFDALGTLSPDANTTRLRAVPPSSSDFAAFPARLSIGSGSGTTFGLAVVANDAAFTPPSPGIVQIAQDTGNLHWNATDLTNFTGQEVRFQRQTFFSFKESSGRIGLITEVLLLSPLPATGQYPLIRIGFGAYLTPVERVNETAFSPNPAAGTVEWALDTGRLKFNATDVSASAGKAVFYEGVVFGFRLALPISNQGTVASPTNVIVPPEDADVYFRIPGVIQFPEAVFVDAFSAFGKQGQVEILRSTGALRFSLFDQAAYGPQAVQMVVPDLPVERGMALRFFRSPVDLADTDPEIKDVSSLYSTTGATLADPIIAAPQIQLPSRPLESSSIAVRVEQGTGTYVGTLPNLDTPSPPSGLGYIIDFERQQLYFAQRKQDVVVQGYAQQPYGAVQLPDPLVFESNLVLELETSPGANTFTPLALNTDVVVDLNPGVARLVKTQGLVLASGSAASFAANVLTDATTDFLASGIAAGHLLVVTTPGVAEGVHTITGVTSTTLVVDSSLGIAPSVQYEVRSDREILADRFFQEVPPVDPNTRVEKVAVLGVASNSPRVSVDVARVPTTRIRFGKTTFATTTIVANDAAFTLPSSLVSETVEVSLDTGNLNFATADLGRTVFLAREQKLGVDYRLQAPLGFIEFTERLLEQEEVHIRYAVLDENDQKVIVEERGSFLVRKEVTQPHPIPTNTLSFNPLSRELAALPPPAAFRGGRPQRIGEQVEFDLTNSTVRFLASDQVTDALPSGAVVGPAERVYVDYYVHEAIGGEKDVTVLQPPMFGVSFAIVEGATTFSLAGDRTADFPAGRLLKVDSTEVYLLGVPTYDASTDITTVAIASPQTFLSDLTNPTLAVSSGQVRVNPTLLFPSYFVLELAAFDSVPRGSNVLRLVGDHSRIYTPGVVLSWNDGGSVLDFNVVDGSTYDADTNRTVVTLKSNGQRQYTFGLIPLRRSVRPILPSPSATITTARTPELQLPYRVYRRVEDSPGVLLTQPDNYSIDTSGRITLVEPLRENEEVSIFYTGATLVEDGRNFRASYSHLIVPSASNGILNQVLSIDYTTYSPDTVYWRVEKLTNFRAELVAKYEGEAQANIPTGGPRLENAALPKLYEQGRPSVFYQEGRLNNEDYVARTVLKFLNDGVNYLEDALQNMDGRVIGDHDGRFRFDGNTNNPLRTSIADVTNDIDDRLKVSDGPPVINFPPFSVSFSGTYQEAYKPSKYSRFYPTRRRLYGVTASPSGLETGDTILDAKFKPMAGVNAISRRLPWAVTTAPAKAGDTTLQVDTTDGSQDLLRPAFDTAYDLTVAIQTQDGTFIASDLTPLTVASKTSTSLTFTSGVPLDVPVGSTVRHVKSYFPFPAPATPYLKTYRAGFDVGVSLDEGVLTHIEPVPPFDGSVPAVPDELCVQNPVGGEVLDIIVQMISSGTEPDRIPALDGGSQDDDRNRRFPILNPSPDSELGLSVGYLAQELAAIQVGGALRGVTTDPYVGTNGSLDVSATVLTNSVNWPAPLPKVHDLIEIRTGLNANSGFRRITAVTANTVTVATPFASQDSGFDFTVTVSNSLATGTGTHTTTTVFTDAGADFVAAGVVPGHTLVMTSGANAGLRRQVVSVTTTTLTTTAFAVAPVVGAAYRVDDALGTFGGVGSLLSELESSVSSNLAVLTSYSPPKPWSEISALEKFFDHFFTDLVSGLGSVADATTFSDGAANFISAGVNASHFVFIRSGANAGVYKIASVDSSTTLTIAGSFPVPPAVGIAYRIVRVDFLGEKSLADAFLVLQQAETAVSGVQAFLSLLTTDAPVIGDAGAFARRTLTADLDARVTQVNTRITQLTDSAVGALVLIGNIMSAGDRLYDKRYVWIDARINQEKGILPTKDRAAQDRVKAKTTTLNQLTKILSMKP